MAFIMKKGARTMLVSGNPGIAEIYPNGIGGIDGHDPCYGFHIGNVRCVMTRAQWLALSESFRGMDKDRQQGLGRP